jgi:F-type H+-transporting ATP synthase subunit e
MTTPTLNVRYLCLSVVCSPAHSSPQVARYTALFTGVVYGWYHRRTLQAAYDDHKLHDAIHERQKLVSDAKAAWARLNDPNASKNSGSFPFPSLPSSSYSSALSAVVTDPDDPRFDLEKLLLSWEKS